MLSSKPLLGYRCMACDRPLEKLDDKTGPFIPHNVMSVQESAKLSREGTRNRREKGDSKGTNVIQEDGTNNSEIAQDVGPNLPKGGWRSQGTQPYTRKLKNVNFDSQLDSASLPNIHL
eukprot:TRINITY_DN55944_c0_g1_i1.p1 TRINITY_DN55944_c0_g1~~TRINITY_DN55944_c0_g1_i1.p1  ORF type:complete len:118 (-),score=2.78 TRINITY_DN55944_c0_g1_i1:17-370(-)